MYVMDQAVVDVRRSTDLDPDARDRRFDRYASGAPESKLQTVRDYLQREFPFATVLDAYDAGQAVHTFRLENDHGSLMHVAVVTVELLQQETDGALRAFLDRHRLFDALYRAGQRPVAVTLAGVDRAR
jgi:hypothetical protein